MAPTLTFISHDAFAADVRALAAALTATPDWQPSLLIGMGRGGLVPAVYLSHATDLPMISCDLSSHATAFADATLARLAERTRDGTRLLFVDDINDSGRTIGLLRRRLSDFDAAPGSVRFATLLDNEVSAERVEYCARTIDRRVVKDWFVFPWEALASKEALAEDAAEVPERIQ